MRIVAAAWLAVVLIVYWKQRSLTYFPDPTRVAPASEGLTGVTEDTLKTPDGETLVAWWTPPAEGKPVVLYFHGNGGNIAIRSGRISLFQQAGFGVYMLSDRGYSGSTGTPNEPALVADAKLAYDTLVKRGVAPGKIVVFGESLGSGLAVQVAASRHVGGIVLDSPYTALPDVGARTYPWLPVHLLMSDRFDSLSVIKNVHAPLLIIHGDADSVVPYDLGLKLFEAANEPKKHLRLPGKGHVMPLRDGAWDTVRPFIDAIGK